MSKKIYYKINSINLGDVICATPTLRKLNELYNQKIIIINDLVEVFENNPRVEYVIKPQNFVKDGIKCEYEFFESFVLPGQKNQFNIERKFNTFDIRQIHCHDLGFNLMAEELNCEFYPSLGVNLFNLPSSYVVLHTAKNWPNRTWAQDKWQALINFLNQKNIFVVLVGKDSIEKDFQTIKKDFYNFNLKNGINLINKTKIDDLWHIINNSKLFITFDTGPLHLAGTTDAFILQLGSAKDPRLVAPYRFGSQEYKYKNLKGSCDLYCTNNLKYSIKEWGSINFVPPLVGCLENKKEFECQPSLNQVIDFINNYI